MQDASLGSQFVQLVTHNFFVLVHPPPLFIIPDNLKLRQHTTPKHIAAARATFPSISCSFSSSICTSAAL